MSRLRKVQHTFAPLPDESASSLVFRFAASEHRSVAEFCEHSFGLTYTQARGDLDRLLPEEFQKRVAEHLSLATDVLGKCVIPATMVRSAYCSSSRRFNQAIKACFPCMRAAHYGRRYWRTIFAESCPIHSCHLTSACPNCGAGIGYQEGNVGLAPLLWLETWPVCTNCLRTMRPTIQPADPCLITATAKWVRSLAGIRPYHWISANHYLRLSRRLILAFEREPQYITARIINGAEGAISPQEATARILKRLWRKPLAQSIFQAALNLPFDPSQLSNDMVN